GRGGGGGGGGGRRGGQPERLATQEEEHQPARGGGGGGGGWGAPGAGRPTFPLDQGRYAAGPRPPRICFFPRQRCPGMPGHLAPRDGLFARTVNAADYRTVLAVLVDEAKPQGISASGREFRDLARLAAELRHASATR